MNSLKMNIKPGTKVVMMGDCPESERVVTVTGGFGASSSTSGTALFVEHKGQSMRFDATEIEKLYEPPEVEKSEPTEL